MEGKTLNLKHYVSVVTQLVFRAAAIAKECAENPDLKKYEKAVNDPVTEVLPTPRRPTSRSRPCSALDCATSSPDC